MTRDYRPRLRPRPHYTTGELAAILQLGPTKVAQLFDAGELVGWRGPGGARYVPHPALVRWLRGMEGYAETLEWLDAACFNPLPS